MVLKFGKSYNNKINYPDKIFYIKYGDNFNQEVNNLPSTLEFLIFHSKFGSKFNQPIDNLPSSLKLLYLGIEFNNSVDFLPNNLQYLNLGEKFNKSIDNLPSSIIELTFCYNERFYVNNDKYDYMHLVIKQILNLFDNYDKKKKKEKYTDYNYNLLLNEQHVFNQLINNLPNYLEFLLLPDNYKEKINILPKNIKYIKFGNNYNKNISFVSNYDKLKLVSISNKTPYDLQKLLKCKSKKITIQKNNKVFSKKIKSIKIFKFSELFKILDFLFNYYISLIFLLNLIL